MKTTDIRKPSWKEAHEEVDNQVERTGSSETAFWTCAALGALVWVITIYAIGIRLGFWSDFLK